MVTTQTADNVLKSYYLDIVSDQLDKVVNPFFAAIKKTTSDVWGKDVRKTMRVGLNGGIGAGTEEGALPISSGNRYAQLVTPLKNLYGTIEISDKAIRASANSEGAFVNLLNDEMEGLVRCSTFNFGRMLFGDGSGALGKLIAKSTGNTFRMNDIRGVVEGMAVDIYDASDNLITEKRIITTVSRDDKMVTFAGEDIPFAPSSSNPTPYMVYLQGSRGLELTGLGAIFGDSPTLYGLNRAEYPFLKPIKQTNVGELNDEKIQGVLDGVEERTGNKVNFIVCSWDARRALAKMLAPYKTMEPLELEGGYRALSYNGIPVVVDRFCPAGTIYFLNTNDFALHQLCDWQWLEGEDGKVLKQVPGKPVYTATLVKYAELICYRPFGQAMMTGIVP